MVLNNFNEFYKVFGDVFKNNKFDKELVRCIYNSHFNSIKKIDKGEVEGFYVAYDAFDNTKYDFEIDLLDNSLICKTFDTALSNNPNAKYAIMDNNFTITYLKDGDLIIEKIDLEKKNDISINTKVYCSNSSIKYLENLCELDITKMQSLLDLENIIPDFELQVETNRSSERISNKLYRNGLYFDEFTDISPISNFLPTVYGKYRNLLDGYDNRVDISKTLKLINNKTY